MATEPELHVALDAELPEEVAVGDGTALFVCGWCFHPAQRIAALELLVDGEPQPLRDIRQPRLDPFRALHPTLDPFATTQLERDPASAEDPLLHAYRSGFWGLARIGPRPAGATLELRLRARLDRGDEAEAPLARIAIVAPPHPLAAPRPRTSATGSEPRVAICMATYNPPIDLLTRQLDSIRAQSHSNWVCVISDDCSSPESSSRLRAMIAGDERFILSRSERRLGFYRNFERALSLAPAEAELIALADQDDSWRPDKLAVLIDAIGDAQLVYSDARVVARDGAELSPTWWATRHNNHSDLLSLLVANSVTGAASLLRAELLATALPFPPHQFAHFHDHWLGLVALACGEIAYVDEPLYDYVQHGNASLGHAAANRMTSLRERLANQRRPAERARMWRLHYFADVWRLRQFCAVLELRATPAMSRRKRSVLRRFLAADRSPLMLARLVARGVRELSGTTVPETLGAEWMLACALLWRRLLAIAPGERPRRTLRLDALPPASLVAEPGQTGLDPAVADVAAKIEPLRFVVAEGAPRRVNLLLPTIDLRHFFGGYIAKLNLAARLARDGVRVRLVTTDPVGALPPGWRETIEGYSGLAGLFDAVELTFGREAGAIEVSSEDRFVATTWWTARIAGEIASRLERGPFLYLIQEYEPFTFPMGTFAALAADSYRSDHVALFSSELLREYFRLHRIGVYAGDADAGDARSASFQNAITAVSPPSPAELSARAPRRLLFYARPEAHAQRNMYELGVLALSRAVAEGVFSDGWELHGIGTVTQARSISLGAGARLDLLPRAAQDAYGALLREHDLGLALMYTPHPSLVPIEMASAGMVTVTSSFENKTPAAMAAISANLICAPPTLTGIVAALRSAASATADIDARVRAAAVNWPTDWDRAFDRELVGWVLSALGLDRLGA